MFIQWFFNKYRWCRQLCYFSGQAVSYLTDTSPQRPCNFSRVLGADKSRLEAFWRNLFASPEGQAYKSLHPILRNKTVEELSSTIPVTLHEDAGPYAKGKSANSLSWQSLLGSGSDLEQNFLHHTEIKRSGAPCYCWPTCRHLFKEFDYVADGTTVEGDIVAQDGDTVWKVVLLFGKGCIV